MASLLLIQTGTADGRVLERHGDYPEQFARGLGLETLPVIDARTETPLPDPTTLGGVVVTGSASMVTDREPWSERLGAWLAAAVAAGTPTLGVCYGHQLLAHALGGEVGWNPTGPHLGPDAVSLTQEGLQDPLLSGLPDIQFFDHAQQILRLPAGAEPLAHSPGVAPAAIRFAPRAWGVQFHPEWSPAIFRDVLRESPELLAGDGRDPELLPLPTSWPGRPLLRRFLELACDR